jgi:hypothetical protein
MKTGYQNYVRDKLIFKKEAQQEDWRVRIFILAYYKYE